MLVVVRNRGLCCDDSKLGRKGCSKREVNEWCPGVDIGVVR